MQRYLSKSSIIGLILLFAVALGASGCKDTKASHAAGLLETCKLALDASTWDTAVTECSKVQTDEGYNLTAQAYMARAGVSLIDILTSMTGGSAAISGLFGAVPTTAAQAADVKLALDSMFLMKTPTQSVYLQGLLLSSLLVIRELQTLVGLQVDASGSITHCAASGSIDGCSFKLSLSKTTYTTADVLAGASIPVDLNFTGMGTALYDGLCGASGGDTHNTKVVRAYSDVAVIPATTPVTYYPVDITEKLTINKCTVSTTSVLYYNNLAATNLTSSITGLDKLNFYVKLDTGQNYTKTFSAGMTSPATVSLCNADAIPASGATDLALNDCEVLYFLENLNLN